MPCSAATAGGQLRTPSPAVCAPQVAVKVLQRIDPKLLHAGSAGLGSKVTRSGRIAEQTLKELGKVSGRGWVVGLGGVGWGWVLMRASPACPRCPACLELPAA